MTKTQREELDLEIKHIEDPWKPLNIRMGPTYEEVWQTRFDFCVKWGTILCSSAIALIVGAEVIFHAWGWFHG